MENVVAIENLSDDERFANCFPKRTVLPKDCLLRAIDKILQPPESRTIGRRAKINSAYGNRNDATNANSLCMDRSHLPLHTGRFVYELKHIAKHSNSLRPILNELRLCLLAGDWDNYKDLLLLMFRSPNVSNEYVLFTVRSCFILLFNHPNRTTELLDNFIAVCLGINDESRKIRYLERCFALEQHRSTCASGKNSELVESEKVVQEEREEEDEMFFNTDYSSD